MVVAALLLVFVGPATEKEAADLVDRAGRSFSEAQYEKAAGELAESLRLNPRQPGAARQLGLCYQLLGQLKLAENSFLKAAELDGHDSKTWFFLGRVYYLQHFFDKALNTLKTAVQLDARDPQIHELLALNLEAAGETEGALREYAEAVRWNQKLPKPLSTPHLSYGVFLHKLDRTGESEKHLQIAARLNPKDWLARFELGKLLYDRDDLKPAIREATVAAQTVAPGSEDAERVFRLIGRIYYRMGRDEEARHAIAMAESKNEPFVPIAFADRTEQSRIDFVLRNHATPEKHLIETMPAGVAVIDYDNDGFEDLYFINGAAIPQLAKLDSSYWNRLYRNNGDGSFTDVTLKAGVKGAGYSMGVAAGDYDNDGWDDLFVAGVDRNVLFHNNHDGTFSDVTESAGMAGGSSGRMWSVSAGWFDYDNDGWLDLFVVNYCMWTPAQAPYCGGTRPGYRTYCNPKMYKGLPNTLYHNERDGTFKDASADSGIRAHIGKGMAVAFADYDDDGRMDALVTNDTERNFLFHNDGNGKFSEIGLKAGVAFNNDGRALSSMGTDFRDIDNDGKPDLLITALSNETFPLFQNLGGFFRDATYSSQLALLTAPWGGWGAGIFDLNNDGLKDIFTANSLVMDNIELFSSRSYRQSNSVFANVGGARFADARAGSGPDFWKQSAHRGCAFGDLNNDGRVDVVVSSLNEPVEFLENISDPRQHWFQLLLTGRTSNRNAIGAKIRLILPDGVSQYNHVTTSVGYASSSSRRVHFGLGREALIENLEIRWPSGIVQRMQNVKTDQLLRITEPAEPAQP